MICETCHGKGMVTLYDIARRTSMSAKPVTGLCPTCGGYGQVHCCEGDQEQPGCEGNDGTAKEIVRWQNPGDRRE